MPMYGGMYNNYYPMMQPFMSYGMSCPYYSPYSDWGFGGWWQQKGGWYISTQYTDKENSQCGCMPNQQTLQVNPGDELKLTMRFNPTTKKYVQNVKNIKTGHEVNMDVDITNTLGDGWHKQTPANVENHGEWSMPKVVIKDIVYSTPDQNPGSCKMETYSSNSTLVCSPVKVEGYACKIKECTFGGVQGAKSKGKKKLKNKTKSSASTIALSSLLVSVFVSALLI